MPGVSTPTITYIEKNIGLGITACYDPSSNDLRWVYDSKRHYTGFRYKYYTLCPDDISQENADKLSSQYPNVQGQIQKIVEDRRHYHEKNLGKQKSKCTIL